MEEITKKIDICDKQEHDRLVAWYGKCSHCGKTLMKETLREENNDKM